jgi:beta-phosphoglucomutase family hydrolase
LLGLPETVHACLFDLDEYLSQRANRTGDQFVPFDPVDDYRRYVDGKKRDDGVRSFLKSRGIELPDGDPDDPADAETVYGLGNRKNQAFQNTLHTDGVQVFDGSRRYLEKVAAARLATAVVSSSANTRDVLEITGLDRLIQQRVDGVTLREEHIPGKPAPDSFLRAAQLLGVAPAAAAVFEDALSGVAAGHAGNFGFVVGINKTGRIGQADELRRNGADIVVTDLSELL